MVILLLLHFGKLITILIQDFVASYCLESLNNPPHTEAIELIIFVLYLMFLEWESLPFVQGFPT